MALCLPEGRYQRTNRPVHNMHNLCRDPPYSLWAWGAALGETVARPTRRLGADTTEPDPPACVLQHEEADPVCAEVEKGERKDLIERSVIVQRHVSVWALLRLFLVIATFVERPR